MNVPDGLFYTKEHEWAKLENDKARVGITDYAQHSLGDVTFIELPKVGAKVEQFKMFSTVESVKAASDVYAPFSGTILEVNEALLEKPELLNQSPYEEAWIAVIKIEDESEKNNLMAAAAYKKYLEEIAE